MFLFDCDGEEEAEDSAEEPGPEDLPTDDDDAIVDDGGLPTDDDDVEIVKPDLIAIDKCMARLGLRELDNGALVLASTGVPIGRMYGVAMHDMFIVVQCRTHTKCSTMIRASVNYLDKWLRCLEFLANGPNRTRDEHVADIRDIKAHFGIHARKH